MTEVCTVNGSNDEFATEARLVKLVGSWVEVEEAALLRDGVMGATVVMMGTAVAVLIAVAYLRKSMLSRGDKLAVFAWNFTGSQPTAPIATEIMLLEAPSATDDQSEHEQEELEESETEKTKEKKKKRCIKVGRQMALVNVKKRLRKKRKNDAAQKLNPIEEEEVVEEEVEVEVQETAPVVLEVEQQNEESKKEEEIEEREEPKQEETERKSCLVRGACTRRSQSAPSVVFAEPIEEDEEERPMTEPEEAVEQVEKKKIPNPPEDEEEEMVKLVLGQEPWEVEISVKESDLNLSAPTASFLRCKGFITWCRDDIKGTCQWSHRCRYAHVGSDALREYLLTILPPIPPQMCPQDFHCNQLNDAHHQAQYRHTCRIPNCQDSLQAWHAIPFFHPPAVPKSMPVNCYSYVPIEQPMYSDITQETYYTQEPVEGGGAQDYAAPVYSPYGEVGY